MTHASPIPPPLFAAILLCACAGPQTQVPAPASRAPPSPSSPADSKAPPWDSPVALAHIWPQEATLLGTGGPCPFLHERKDGPTSSLIAYYQGEEVHRGPFALRLRYSGARETSGGFGVGCLRYDAGLFTYVRFWIKGQPGERFQFRLKDATGHEGTVMDLSVKGAGWRRIIIPLKEFRGIDMRSVASFTFSFKDTLGPADLYLDDFEFNTQPDSE